MSAKRPIHALGEIALTVNDLDTMQAFYELTIGLALLQRFPDAVFFKIGEGYAGHTQILALFRRAAQPAPVSERSTLDHLALTIALADYAGEHARLAGLGLHVRTRTFPWVQWRSLFVQDPEGNVVELVCFDPSIAQT